MSENLYQPPLDPRPAASLPRGPTVGDYIAKVIVILVAIAVATVVAWLVALFLGWIPFVC